MRNLKLLMLFTFIGISFLGWTTPQDSIVVKIDARNQELIGAKSKGKNLKEEVAGIFEKNGISLTDSLWSEVKSAITKSENQNQRLEFSVNGKKVVMGLFQPKWEAKNEISGAAKDLSLKEGIHIKDGREEVSVSLKDGIHVKDGAEEVIVNLSGISVKDGNEKTEIIWGKDFNKKKEDGIQLMDRRGFSLNFGLNNWSGTMGGGMALATAIYPPPLLETDKNLSPLGSRYVSMEWSRFLNLSKGKKSAFRLGFGLGVEWVNLMFDHHRIIQNNGSAINFAPVLDKQGAEIKFSKNKLAASYLTLPIMPHISFDKKSTIQMIALGGYVGYRLDSWVKTKEENSGDKNHVNGSYLLKDFRYGARMEVYIRNFPDLFFNYDVTPVFQDNKGANLNVFSFGVRLLKIS